MKSKLLDVFGLASLSRWMIPPAQGWYSKGRDSLISSGIYWPFQGIIICLSLIICTTIAYWFFPDLHSLFINIQIVLTLITLTLTIRLINNVQQNLIVPLAHVRHWALRMRGGNLIAKIPTPDDKNEFHALTEDINQLSTSLKNLTQDMKEQVRIQSYRLEQKSNSLSILYDVARNINQSEDLESLLKHFLCTLIKLTHAEAASVRMLTNDNKLRLIAHIGLSEKSVEIENNIPIGNCICGDSVKSGTIRYQPVSMCNKILQTTLFENRDLTTIAVPLMYRSQCLGIYNFYVKDPELIEREELNGLLTSIGQNLGFAIAKQNLETQTKRSALMEERIFLSHELHDSLAQSLVGLKFKTQLLKDSYKNNAFDNCDQELKGLEDGLNEANDQLRDLLDHFRVGMDERGLMPALAELIQSFQSETQIYCYFQNESNGYILPPIYEVQVLHIVQEALSNIRKHSKAGNVRIVIQKLKHHWKVLIEDDGIGIPARIKNSRPGESIGLSIMRERAEHIKGLLTIESEANEGTRVELKFAIDEYMPLTNIVDISLITK